MTLSPPTIKQGGFKTTPSIEPFRMARKVNKMLIVIFMVVGFANFSEYILYNP